MKSLIRPLLLAVVRLALFLSATAWIVGQWWTAEITTPISSTHISVSLLPSAWMFGTDIQAGDAVHWSLTRVPAEESGWLGDSPGIVSFEDMTDFEDIIEGPDGSIMSVFGTVYNGHFLLIPHWMIVATFCVLMAVIHVFCRRRPNQQPSTSEV